MIASHAGAMRAVQVNESKAREKSAAVVDIKKAARQVNLPPEIRVRAWIRCVESSRKAQHDGSVSSKHAKPKMKVNEDSDNGGGGGEDAAGAEEAYAKAVRSVFPGAEEKMAAPDYVEDAHVPTFGSPVSLSSSPLPSCYAQPVKLLLCVLGDTKADLTYCPPLLDLLPLLLKCGLRDGDMHRFVGLLLDSSKLSPRLLPLGAQSTRRCMQTFDSLLRQKLQPVHSHLHSVGMAPATLFFHWYSRLFVGWVSDAVVVRILDCFFAEGFKVLYRVSLGLCKLFKQHILEAQSAMEVEVALRTHMLAMGTEQTRRAFDFAFSFKLKRKNIQALFTAHDASELPPLPVGQNDEGFHVPKFDESQSDGILTAESAWRVWSHLPPRFRIHNPSRRYATHLDGYSLSILTRAITGADSGPGLLLCKDTKGHTCGVFMAEPPKPPRAQFREAGEALQEQVDDGEEGGRNACDGQCAVFSLTPAFAWHPVQEGRTAYFHLQDDLFGVGDGDACALSFGPRLKRAWTAASEVFGNEDPVVPVEAGDGQFQVTTIEFWGFSP